MSQTIRDVDIRGIRDFTFDRMRQQRNVPLIINHLKKFFHFLRTCLCPFNNCDPNKLVYNHKIRSQLLKGRKYVCGKWKNFF